MRMVSNPQMIGQADPARVEDADDDSAIAQPTVAPATPADAPVASAPFESGSQRRLDPTRYGDWERNGRCIDF